MRLVLVSGLGILSILLLGMVGFLPMMRPAAPDSALEVIYVDENTQELRLFDTFTQVERPLLTTPSAQDKPIYRTIVLSPDGQWIYYVSTLGLNQVGLYRVHIDTNQRSFIAPTSYSRVPLIFSPDNEWVVFNGCCDPQSGFMLAKARPDGAHVDTIAAFDFSVGNTNIDWSPNGEWLAFTMTTGTVGLYRMQADGSQLKRIFERNRGTMIAQPIWSPDSQFIYFTETQIPAGYGLITSRIYRVARDGGAAELLSEPQVLTTAWEWSPDKQWLLISIEDVSGFHTLYKMRGDGSEVTPLTDKFSLQGRPLWAANGQWVYFYAPTGQQRLVGTFRVKADGSRTVEYLAPMYGRLRPYHDQATPHPWRIGLLGMVGFTGVVLVNIRR